MTDGDTLDPQKVKKDSERIILAAGGRICDWLPHPDRAAPRSLDQLVGRALVMNALLNIAFEAPVSVIRDWTQANSLATHLSSAEQVLLTKRNGELSDQENINLYWYIEALWALMWAGSLIPDLPIDQPVGDTMASLVPNLQEAEGTDKFAGVMRLRPYGEIYRMLDLYYRAHWFTEDARINGYATGEISGDVIMERRKALEWLMNESINWDNVPLDT